MVWKCSQCDENIDDQFDSCWSCGADKDGNPNPAFQIQDESSKTPFAAKGEHDSRGSFAPDRLSSGVSAIRAWSGPCIFAGYCLSAQHAAMAAIEGGPLDPTPYLGDASYHGWLMALHLTLSVLYFVAATKLFRLRRRPTFVAFDDSPDELRRLSSAVRSLCRSIGILAIVLAAIAVVFVTTALRRAAG